MLLDIADACLKDLQRTSCCEDPGSNVVFCFVFVFIAKVGAPFVGPSCQPFLIVALFRS